MKRLLYVYRRIDGEEMEYFEGSEGEVECRTENDPAAATTESSGMFYLTSIIPK